jgi:hypothetical protein
MQEDHDSLREETKNKNVEELESMKHELLKKIEELDKQFDVEFQTYVQETENRSTKYKELLEKNRIDSDDINQAQNKINGFKEQNSYWTLKRVQNKRDCTLRNEQLAREKKKIVDHYHSLKKKMAYQREDKEKHLGTLSMNALSCMETLHDYQNLGEKILKTAELCRKLETEKEKVLPFYQSDADTTEDPDMEMEKISGLDKHAFNEFKMLDNFYKRYNKVHLDKLAIEKQKATLDKENMFFKNLLKQYLDGVSVNDDVINANNPLLVINYKVNLNRPPVIAEEGRHNPFIEGNQEISNYNLQRNANYH